MCSSDLSPDPRGLADLARGSMLLPAIGLAQGAAVAGLAALGERWLPAVVLAPLVVALLLAVQRGAPAFALAHALAALVNGGGRSAPGSRAEPVGEPHPHGADVAAPGAGAVALGTVGLALVLAAKALAVVALADRGLGLALLLAVMLGRWAVVVQTYGSMAAPGDGFTGVLVRRIEFREFGTASVMAMALTLMLANAVGLVLLFAVAGVSIAARILAHRVAGGVTRTSVAAGGELAETAALLACAALARLLGAA